MRLPKNRSFRLLLSATVVSQLGDWASRLALAFLVLDKTGSQTMVGVTAALLTIPWLGLGQWLTKHADRFDRRQLLVFCDSTRGALFVLIGLVDMPLPALLGLVFIVATIDPIFEANRSAMIADIVSKRDYANAIQATHGVNQVAQLAGFALGGTLVAAFNVRPALVLNGGSFFVSSLLMWLVKVDASASQRTGGPPSFGEALKFLRRDRLSLVAVSATVVVVALANAVETQVTVYGTLVAELSRQEIGFLAAAVPLSTLLVIWALDSTGPDEAILQRGIVMALVASVPASGLLWIGRDSVSIALGFVCLGAVFVLSTAGNIVAGRRIPAEIRVGTFAVLQAAVYVAVGVGAYLGGVASKLWSPQHAAGGALALCTVSCVVALIALRRYVGWDGQYAKEAEPSSPISG